MLRFDDFGDRESFLSELRTFMERLQIPVSQPVPMTERQIFKTAVTKESRKKLLERFFRVTFAYVRRVPFQNLFTLYPEISRLSGYYGNITQSNVQCNNWVLPHLVLQHRAQSSLALYSHYFPSCRLKDSILIH